METNAGGRENTRPKYRGNGPKAFPSHDICAELRYGAV